MYVQFNQSFKTQYIIDFFFVFEVKPLSQINIYGQMCALFD